jgi:hypothetical protein
MATVAFSVFYDHILPELPKCTTGMVDLHLLHTARDFCEKTSAWRFPFTVSGVADEDTYDISVPDTASEIVRVTRMVVDDELLWDVDWTPDSQGDAPKYDRAEPPFSINNLNTELVFLEDEIPTAAGTDNIELTAALKPGFSATVLPDFLKFQHLEAMRTGVLSRLMRMGAKPWTNVPLAVEYGRDYQRACLAASTAAKRGNTRAPLRSRKWG